MRKKEVFLLLSILALGAFLRFYQITEIPLGLYPDEAMNGNNAREALQTGNFKVFYPENNGREGFFINIQAISLAVFGNEPWALRLISALFGTLTILSLFLLTKELFLSKDKAAASLAALDRGAGMVSPAGEERRDRVSSKSWLGILNVREDAAALSIALLASFFTATSYWHLNFSRIGFRAILVPFFATFGLYFLLKGIRRGTTFDFIAAGVFLGLGFHTYIAFRFMPLVIVIPLLAYLWRWWKDKEKSCAPCTIFLFLFVVFVAVLPLTIYFLQHPEDIVGRSGQVSIFSAESPLKEFLKSTGLTLQMFFWQGDCNWRHNFNCQPQLHPLTAFFSLVGFSLLIARLIKKNSPYQPDYRGLASIVIPAWFFFMILPAALTREGLPHAIRSIGMIPPVMIFAGAGAWWIVSAILQWLQRQKEKWPQYHRQLSRIQRESVLLFVAILLLIPLHTYRTYFLKWAHHPETYFSLSTDLLHLGQFLNGARNDVAKYVIVNLSGVAIRGIPAPAQTVMFATDTFTEEKRREKNIVYLLPQEVTDKLIVNEGQKVLIAPLNGLDRNLIRTLKTRFPGLSAKATGDFVVMQNY